MKKRSCFLLLSIGLFGTNPAVGVDFDGDGHVDLRDYAALQVCFTDSGGGPPGVGCEVFDRDGDEDVDASDYAAFLMEFTGPVETVPVAGSTPGVARAWEAGMGVGTSTSVNLRNGNLLSMVPILGWSGRGPTLGVGLFHNSGGVGDDVSFGAGFDLGAGWTLSYGGYVLDSGTEAVVLDDDGTRTTYAYNEGQYVAPAGLYSTLEKIDGVGWRLTYKDQSRREYDTAGRLTGEWDASSNGLLIHRDAEHGDRICEIEDAGGRTVTFSFDGQDRLDTITDPGIERSWTLVYDVGSSGLSEIRSPLYEELEPDEHVWKFVYDDDGRIVSLADKAGAAFTYQYGSGGRLLRAYDPGELSDQFQQFGYTDIPSNGPDGPYQKTRYTDRRGQVWTFRFDDRDDLVEFANPLDELVQLEHGSTHEVSRYTDPTGRYWDYTHDDRGNLTDVVDQFNRGSHWVYDELNNLTSHTDAMGRTWTLEYNDADNPTSVTDIYEPGEAARGTGPHTQIAYFDIDYTPPGMSQADWNGLVETVTDPMGIATTFEYDEYGQMALYSEGNGELVMNYSYNSAGWLRDSWVERYDGCRQSGALLYDDEGNVTGSYCPILKCFKEPDRELPYDKPYGEAFSQYDSMGRLVLLDNDVHYDSDDWQSSKTRTADIVYDALGRPGTRIESTDESGNNVERVFDFVHDDGLGMYTVSGPDGADTVVTVDEAGRAAVVEQDANWASYTYYADGRVDSVSRGNGTFTEYAYDFENLTMAIEHYGSNGTLMLGLEYAFTTNGLVASISESNTSGLVATTTFEHDVRGRLTEENRVGADPYLATYDYDDNGNRTSDTLRIGEGPEPGVSMIYQHSGNRLTGYMKRVDATWVEEGTYYYDENGNVSHIVRRSIGSNTVLGTRFLYDKMGRVWRALGYEWEEQTGLWHQVPDSYWDEEHWVALSNEAFNWDDAAALAEGLDGRLAEVPTVEPGVFDWFVETFQPSGDETRYWLGGQNDYIGWPNCQETTYECWQWLEIIEGSPMYRRSYWIPEDYALCGDWPDWCGSLCVLGGWLAREPDDGQFDCVENGEEERMQFVFNRGGHADSNGFADAHESELCRALIVREDEVPPFPSEPTWAKEFRYAGPRQRYLTRQLDPTDLSVVLSETWSDYVSNSIYADYTVNGGIATEQTRYLPGHWQTNVQASTTAFVHTNTIGTTRMFTNDDGAPIADTNRLYTAFGVPVTTPDTPLTRYGYAGKWGYQEHENMPFLHVGARYYDPSLGRFLQRDPIGIMGGSNVYEYVWNNPTSLVDPEGAYPRGALEMQGVYKGLRTQGYTPVEASEAMAKMAKFEAKAAVVWTGVFTCGRAGAPIIYYGGRHILRSPYVRRYIRFERHQIPGLRNYGPVHHINIGRKHIIIDRRVILDWIRQLF